MRHVLVTVPPTRVVQLSLRDVSLRGVSPGVIEVRVVDAALPSMIEARLLHGARLAWGDRFGTDLPGLRIEAPEDRPRVLLPDGWGEPEGLEARLAGVLGLALAEGLREITAIRDDPRLYLAGYWREQVAPVLDLSRAALDERLALPFLSGELEIRDRAPAGPSGEPG